MTMDKTLKEARAEFAADLKNGTVCPCCCRYARVNKVVISKAMVMALGWLCRHSLPGIEDGWVRVQDSAPKWILRSNSHAKLTHWGLIERKAVPGGGKGSGVYRPTRRGRLFIDGHLSVPKAQFVYNDKAIKADESLVDVKFCLGVPFDYDAMVRRAA